MVTTLWRCRPWLSWFRGIGNAPRLTAQPNGTLRPDYSHINQMGLDIQYLWADTALKGELIQRKANMIGLVPLKNTAQEFWGWNIVFNIADSGSDLVLFTEYAFDSRNSLCMAFRMI